VRKSRSGVFGALGHDGIRQMRGGAYDFLSECRTKQQVVRHYHRQFCLKMPSITILSPAKITTGAGGKFRLGGPGRTTLPLAHSDRFRRWELRLSPALLAHLAGGNARPIRGLAAQHIVGIVCLSSPAISGLAPALPTRLVGGNVRRH
jgi:hypothetical protein